MAVEWSTGLRNFVNNFGSYKQAMTGGKMVIYAGTRPTSPDLAITGSALLTYTISSGAHTKETQSRGSVTITVDGTVTGITVNSVQIMSGTVTAQGTVTDTAAAVAANINAFQPIGGFRYKAWNVAGKIFIEALPGNGTTPNGYVVASAGSSTRTDVNMGTERAGVASVNGITFGASSDGVISKSGVWSGVVAASGTASFFVIYGATSNDNDTSADASPYHCLRIVGDCGGVGSDYEMVSTALTAGDTRTIDSGDVTLNEEV